jgi:hypothetical protein
MKLALRKETAELLTGVPSSMSGVRSINDTEYLKSIHKKKHMKMWLKSRNLLSKKRLCVGFEFS